jgi:hypothetical protein
MSKKRAVDYELRFLHKNRPYITIDFIDKKGRVMLSSVDVLYNSYYLSDENDDWDYQKLAGFVKTR